MGKSKLVLIGAALASMAVMMSAADATRRGTSVLHYMTRTPFATTELGTNASASLRLQHNEQGRSALQKFNLKSAGLAPNTEYFLSAVLGEEPTAIQIGTATTDGQGRLRVSFMKKGQGNGNPSKALPEELDPVSSIREISLQETVTTQTVAVATINTSPSYQYLVKRNLTQQDTNATPAGSVSLKANASTVNFRLLADGLAAGGTYHLAINESIVESVTADESGAAQIVSWPATAPALLDLRSVSFLDGSSNVVLSATLPK